MSVDFEKYEKQHFPIDLEDISAGWEITNIESISIKIEPGFASGKQDQNENGVPHLRPMNIDRSGAIDMAVVKRVLARPEKTLAIRDVLFNNTNSPELVGKTALIRSSENGFAFSNHMTRISVPILVSSNYIAFYLHFLWQSGYTKHRCTNHVNQASISSTSLAKSFPFLLPPENEQTRIVEKLEELLSDLDNGVAELKAAQTKLSQYRQSLLKSAVEGSLTAEWRKQNPVTETGEQLLQRSLTERRQRWEQQKLAEFKEKGKTPPKDWQKKYPEPVKPNITNLPELPEGWAWTSLSQIGWIDRGRSKHRPRSAKHLYDGKYPFVQTGDIRNSGQYITSTSKTYSDAGLEQSKLWPKGTMCITIAANIGETAILSFDACFPDSVVGFIPVLPEQTIEYIEYSFRTLKEKLDAEAPATAQKNINLEILAREVLPLPPINEQKKILEELSKGFSQIDSQLTSLTLGLKQADAQRKNILKDAFSGQLVPQDPTDEPANVLLEKIKAERLAQAKLPKPKRTKKKANDKASIMDTLLEALKAKGDWMDAQEAFELCGVAKNTSTDIIETLYLELRDLLQENMIEVKRDGNTDKLRFIEET